MQNISALAEFVRARRAQMQLPTSDCPAAVVASMDIAVTWIDGMDRDFAATKPRRT